MIADLTNRTALVTGGGRGIGRGIALILAQQGADVAIGDINQNTAANVAKEVQALKRRALALHLDVTSRASANQAVSTILQSWGKLDILVNNAGVISAPGYENSPEDRDEDWELTYQVNVKGIVNCVKAAMPHMIQRRYGKIINIASIAGRWSNPRHLHYCASKAAVINYTHGLARLLAPHNINANAICPGILWTEMWQSIGRRLSNVADEYKGLDPKEIERRSIAQRIPLGREQTPEDVGKAIAFLVSDDAINITGQALHVDGGAVMI